MSVVNKLQSISKKEHVNLVRIKKTKERQGSSVLELGGNENRNGTNRLTSGEMLINSLDHNFKFGFRTSSRKVINNPHGCGRLATSRSNKTLQNKIQSKIQFISALFLPNNLFL